MLISSIAVNGPWCISVLYDIFEEIDNKMY